MDRRPHGVCTYTSKPPAVPRPADGRRVEGDGYAVGLLHADTGQFLDNIFRGGRAFGPVFERDKHGRRTGFIASADQIKAIDHELRGLPQGPSRCWRVPLRRFWWFERALRHRAELLRPPHIPDLRAGTKLSGTVLIRYIANADDASEYDRADNLVPDGSANHIDIEIGQALEIRY